MMKVKIVRKTRNGTQVTEKISQLRFPESMIVDLTTDQLFDIESTLLESFRFHGAGIFHVGLLLEAFLGKENAQDLSQQAHDLVLTEQKERLINNLNFLSGVVE